jgi:uncharacterized protein YcaQ
MKLSQEAVRGLMIACMGLDDTLRPPATKDDVLAAVRQLHRVQIDSISVVARAHYFVLWSRVGEYPQKWLDDLLEEGALFEYWAHGMCYIPIEDYPIYRAYSRIVDEQRIQTWLDDHPDAVNAVMERIRTQGETRATDYERPKVQRGEWFNYTDEKAALQQLHLVHKLMIRRRDNLHAVYDLPERVYPQADSLPKLTVEEAQDRLVLHTIQVYGVAKTEWLSSYYRLKQVHIRASLKRLEKQNRVLKVDVEGWDKPGYVHPANAALVEAAAAGSIPQSKTTLLSPFDPLVSSPGRLADLFNFDYKIEFYFPEAKRKYGYYSLAILHNNRFVGRLDPKTHRKDGIFEIKSLHLEPDVEVDDELITALRRTIRACAWWHDTPEIKIDYATDYDLAEALMS